MKPYLDITILHRNKTILVQPTAGHLLTMKYQKEERSEAQCPAVRGEAAE